MRAFLEVLRAIMERAFMERAFMGKKLELEPLSFTVSFRLYREQLTDCLIAVTDFVI